MRKKARGKGQVFLFEFAFAVLALTLAIGVYFQYKPETQNRLEIADLNNEVNLIAESLMGIGYPYGWTPADVERIGLTNGDGHLNMTKLSFLSNMTYDETRFLFGTRFEYMVFVEYRNGSLLTIEDTGLEAAGKDGYTRDNIFNDEDITALITLERIAIYSGDLVRIVIYLWMT